MVSVLDFLRDSLNSDGMPNKFSNYLGEQIRRAREEKGYSQEELAEKIYKRRASLSDIENGKMYVDVVSLFHLAVILDKPLDYFSPPNLNYPKEGNLSADELELLIQYRRIQDKKQRKLAVNQIKAIVENE